MNINKRGLTGRVKEKQQYQSYFVQLWSSIFCCILQPIAGTLMMRLQPELRRPV